MKTLSLEGEQELRFRLAPYFSVGVQKNVLYLSFGSIQKKVEDPSKFEIYLKVAELFKNFITYEKALMALKSWGLPLPEARSILQFFLDSKFLMQEGGYDRRSRYSRHSLFYSLSGAVPQKVQDRMKEKHVAILGCGGIGNLVAVNLATAGVGEMTLYDQDKIELSNLTRQIMFTEADVGENKVEILAKQIRKRASNVKLNEIEHRVTKKSDLSLLGEVDLIVLSADGGPILSLLNDFCLKAKVPFLNVGYVQDIAVWGPFVVPGHTGCFFCQDVIAGGENVQREVSQLIKELNKDYHAPSIGPINMMAAAHASLDILKYLGGFGEIHSKNKRLGIWTHNFKFESQDCSPNTSCKACSRARSVPQ